MPRQAGSCLSSQTLCRFHVIDFDIAQRVVTERLAHMEREMQDFGSALPGDKEKPFTQLSVAKVIEYDFGWAFVYNTKQYLDTDDIEYALVGNAPFIVDKADGELYVTGTARPLAHYVDEFRNGFKHRA